MRKIKYYYKNDILDFQRENLQYVLNLDESLEDVKVTTDGKLLTVLYNSKIDEELQKNKILKTIKAYDLPIKISNKIIFSNINECSREKTTDFFEELLQKGIVYKELDGVYIYFGIMNKLYITMCNYFRKKIIELGAEEVYIPSLLSKNTLDVTNYTTNNKKLCNYVSHDCSGMIIDGILNPAACQPLYKTIKQVKDEKLYTGFARVFRFEGDNYFELSRLREYSVRELVYISKEHNVKNFKNQIIELVKKVIKELNLTSTIEVANDMFFEEEFASKSVFQIINENKLEIKLYLNKTETVSAGSLNEHGDFFAKKWNIKIDDEYANTFCLGLGIERWCYAILCQFGYNEDEWPDNIKDWMKEYNE